MSFTRFLRTTAVVLATTGATLALLMATGPAAQAHTKLVSSTPADGDSVSIALAQITLTFDEPLMQSADTISINDASGQVVASQQVQPNGAVISVPWPADLRPGAYEIAYRVVADDGHPELGAIHFTFTGAAGNSSGPSAVSASAASPSPPASASASLPATSAENTTSTGRNTMTLGIILLAVLVVFGFVLTLRRRKRP